VPAAVDKDKGEENALKGQSGVILERTPKPKDVYYRSSNYSLQVIKVMPLFICK
jgi:hypothetical protein